MALKNEIIFLDRLSLKTVLFFLSHMEIWPWFEDKEAESGITELNSTFVFAHASSHTRTRALTRKFKVTRTRSLTHSDTRIRTGAMAHAHSQEPAMVHTHSHVGLGVKIIIDITI